MSKKKYTTKQQREILESVGIPHVQGRSFDEADNIINELIRSGKLPQNAKSPATPKQISFLIEHGVEDAPQLTKEKASELISAIISRDRSGKKCTEKQLQLIDELGGVKFKQMDMNEASNFIDYLMDLHEDKRCSKCGWKYGPNINRCPKCNGFIAGYKITKPPLSIYQPKSLREWVKYFLS